MRTTPPNMSKNNFPWSSSRKVQNEESLSPNPSKTEEYRGKHSILREPHHQATEKNPSNSSSSRRRKLQAIAVSRIRSVITAFIMNKPPSFPGSGSLGTKIVGTLFGFRKGHVHFVFQREHNSTPVFFIELATPITHLVKEMASGLVRIALECDKQEEQQEQVQQETEHTKKKKQRRRRLLDEPLWRTYCNGKKCGFATKREIGANEAKILKAVEPISMGAGVLPGFNGSGAAPEGELMYMRAKFERVVGSRDSEAFYMMNPDCNGAPELSIYLLRV